MATRNSNGEGSLYQKNGTWVLQISTVDEMGKPCRKSFTGKTKKSVREKRKEYLEQKEMLRKRAELGLSMHADNLAKQDISLTKWVFDWIQLYKKDSIKKSTYAAYMQIWEKQVSPFFGATPLAAVGSDEIQMFYNYLLTEGRIDGKKGGLSPKSVRNVHMMIKSALQMAVGKIIIKNPVEETTRPPVLEKDMRVLTSEEMEIFIKEVRVERLSTALFLALFTGIRMGELLALTWDDVNEKKKTIQINKNLVRVTTYDAAGKKSGTELILQTPKSAKSHRTIPVQEDVFQLLMELREEQINGKDRKAPTPNPLNLLFPSRVGTHTDPRTYQKCVADVSERCKIQHVNVHALRHTFATRLVEQKVPIRIIQELLGHSAVTTTMRYTHALESEKEKAIDSMNIWLKPEALLSSINP